MPELPEVETVRRGLLPVMEGARITEVTLNRPDLRFPFPAGFAEALRGQTVTRLDRRGKYLIAGLSDGASLIMHLGMSGRFEIEGVGEPGHFTHKGGGQRHIHVVMTFEKSGEASVVTYADPRRFGFMDLVGPGELETCRHFAAMGPEPLSPQFTAAALLSGLKGRSTPLKSALLDQRVVAGLGNIYVCEALFRAGLSPKRLAKTVGPARAERLYHSITQVLEDAIEAGGSTLRDFAATDGAMGYFQHRFDVYDREGRACPACGGQVARIVQSGRSTFFCGKCQR